jgi:hypothetical protein
MVPAIRKLTTKPTWWWERRRNYRIRFQFDELPPIAAERGGKRFVVLTTPETFNDALWSAWSWYRFLREKGFALELAVDGGFSQQDSNAAARLFPGISVYSAQSVSQQLCEMNPALQTFLHGYPTGRKLALILALSGQAPMLYSDSDVLAFNPPEELLKCVVRNVPCYFMEEFDGTRDALIVERAHALGLDYLPKFNSGLLYIPQGTLSTSQAAKILAAWRPPANSWYSEQTLLSVMLRNSNAEALPPSRYVISSRRQFYWERDVNYAEIVARHFTGTVRHVMYRYGMPILLKQSRSFLESTHQYGRH